MSDKTILEQWRAIAYDQQADRNKLQRFWANYFNIEKGIYEQLLSNPDEVVTGTVKELAEKYGQEVLTMVGFLDGINDSLKIPNPIETMDENTKVSLCFDKELLYKNMVDARADWLYELPQWDAIFTPEKRKELYLEQKKSGTVVKAKKIGRNDPCPCGSGKKYKACHAAFDDKLARLAQEGHVVPTHDLIKNADQIAGIKESCKINIAVLDYIEKHIHEGMNTAEIDKIVYDMTTEMGGIPAPLNYEGYPYSVCTSVNDQVCHGFPSKDVILKSGDIINVDVSTILNGYFSDSSRMFCIGDVSPEKKRLVEVTKECVELGLKEVKPWGFLGDMGQAVHDHAFANGYTVVREIGGHGVGLEFHEEPWVGYNTKRGQEMLLVPGMIFTIEPMVNMGKVDIYVDSKNDWEVYTEDGLPSAQWEIMVLVTEDGHEVLCW